MKVVITDYQYANIDQEKKIFTENGIELYEYQIKDPQKLIGLIDDMDAVITQYSEINREVIEHLDHCKVIIKYGIGVNNIDVEAATEKGIYVCNVPDYGIEEVSNHAVALILALARKLPTITRAFREGDWGYSSVVPLHRFSEATVGLAGFGRIPQLVAKKLSGFGVKILAYDPYINEEIAQELNVKSVDFETLCKESDYVSVHCPLTKETEGIFNREVFKKMKSSAVIVNTARGPVINETDLIESLRNGEISGAGLDVFTEEPLKNDSPLLNMEQVIATPHCAWYTEESILTLQRKVAEEVANVLNGNEPFNCVNKRDLNKNI